jgi:cytochrome c oxidase subunit 2
MAPLCFSPAATQQGMTSGRMFSIRDLAIAACLSIGLMAPAAAQVAAVPTAEVVATDVAPSVVAADAPFQHQRPEPGIGQPVPRGIDLQTQVTPIGQEAAWMVHYLLNPVMIGISLFVLGLLFWVAVRYREAANPVPAKFTHNFKLEFVWTLVPALILVFIAFPSFRLLANQYSPPQADLTIKATGFQWYWGYEFPDYGDVSFDALPASREEAAERGAPYLLETDNRLVVPAGKTVKLLVTAGDVLHSWALPAFWVKMDAVPGRINETWFKVDRPGVYYGQCSELCGTKHGFMPITVEVVPEADFLRWMRQKQAEQGIEPTGPGIGPAERIATAAEAISERLEAHMDAEAEALAPAPDVR